MGCSWAFSISVYDIPKNRYNEIKEILVQFIKYFKSDLSDDEIDNNIIEYYENQIEIIECNIYGRYDFETTSILYFKDKIWKNGFINFDFGAEVREGLETFSYDEDDYKAYIEKLK